MAPPEIGIPVAKVGIRTGYTEGVIVSNANVRWKAESTQTIDERDPEFNLFPVSSAYAIQGDMGQLFADSGDSGSSIEKCLAVGMIYAILLEEPPMPSLTFFYPIKDLMDKLRRETGLDLFVDEKKVTCSNDPWPYMEHGAGRSWSQIIMSVWVNVRWNGEYIYWWVLITPLVFLHVFDFLSV